MMIRPAADLQKDWESVSGYCKEFDEPVYLTEDGTGEFVLMSLSHYQSLKETLEIQGKVLSAEADFYKDGISYTPEEVDRMMREVIDGTATGQSEQAA